MDQNEYKRLEALKSFNMDLGMDARFENIAKLVALVCGTSMALISVVDSERSWFKATVGTEIKDVPRNISFCTYAIQTNEVMEVKDTLLDERFIGNPFVLAGPHIRYYAGKALQGSSGFNFGVICVMNDKPHELTPSQFEALNMLAVQVVELMELHKTIKDLKKKLAIRGEEISHKDSHLF